MTEEKKKREGEKRNSWTEGKEKEEKKRIDGPLVLTSNRAVML